jgi:cytochrome c-type biogenesis protein CcmH/NrfF
MLALAVALGAFGAATLPAQGTTAAPTTTSAADTTPAMVGITAFTPAIGADPVLEEKVKAVSAKLRCPVCQGLSLQDSPSELAQQMRGVVREQLAAGKSADDVQQYFVEKYGEWILLEPSARGFNSLVYALPAILILLGGIGIWFAVRKWTTPQGTGDDPSAGSAGTVP